MPKLVYNLYNIDKMSIPNLPAGTVYTQLQYFDAIYYKSSIQLKDI